MQVHADMELGFVKWPVSNRPQSAAENATQERRSRGAASRRTSLVDWMTVGDPARHPGGH
jgi:hypothetical protein